jgi:hypothetical protein
MSDFEDSTLRYDKMVENALRGVVKQAIEEVRDNGLPGEHHFYITFMTDYPGVEIPDYLRERYPGEMTIVLQYQFYDLDVTDEYMTVTLSFNNVPEALKIPLGAISIFADPSVNFALQFQPMDESEQGEENLLDSMSDELEGEASSSSKKKDEDDEKKGEVVSLDQFRKRDK